MTGVALEAGAPECKPLTSPDELEGFGPSSVHDVCRCSVPLLQEAPPRGARPRLLACHDLRGGYLEDRWPQGGSDAGFYYFRHWHAIDLFVYFSHHLVSIPPVGWVNAGHRHGVPVLGTFITEWDQGAEYCRRLFGTEAAAERTAGQLAAVAWAHGFDGWVINIENSLDREQVPHMLHFLRVLTRLLRSVSPRTEVVWYDAVTVEGRLEWQDTLNELNRPFFEASTALWINYTWKVDTPAWVSQEAGERRQDVFMGVDVFGRGTFGGGGYNCSVALEAARAQGLSAALFAVGWPWDAEHGSEGPAQWWERDSALWASIAAAWGGRRPLLTQLPLRTDFSVGAGRRTMHRGSLLCSSPWYNLSRQGLQPSLCVRDAASPGGTHSPWLPAANRTGPELRACPTLKAAYSGGSCVRVAGALRGCQLLSLFSLAAPVPVEGLEVGYVVASAGESQPVLVLRLEAAGAASQPCEPWVPGSGEGGLSARDGSEGARGGQLLLSQQGEQPHASASGASCMLFLLPGGQQGAPMQERLGQLAAGCAASTFIQPLEVAQDASEGQAAHNQLPGQLRGQREQGQGQQQQPELGQQDLGQEEALAWVQLRYRIPQGTLPAAPGLFGWQLAAVDLALMPSSAGDCSEATLHLGELWIEEPGGAHSDHPCHRRSRSDGQ